MTTATAPTFRPAPNAIEAYIEQILDELFIEEAAQERIEPSPFRNSLAECSLGDYLKYEEGEA
jgi:hypothetical protein